jgi:hypothetical protein
MATPAAAPPVLTRVLDRDWLRLNDRAARNARIAMHANARRALESPAWRNGSQVRSVESKGAT